MVQQHVDTNTLTAQTPGHVITNTGSRDHNLRVTWSAGSTVCTLLQPGKVHNYTPWIGFNASHPPAAVKHRQPKCCGALLRSTSAEWFNSQARSSLLFQLQPWVLLSEEALAFGRWQMDRARVSALSPAPWTMNADKPGGQKQRPFSPDSAAL